MIDGLAPAMLSSMAQDLLRGRPLELEWLSGSVVRRGEARGVPTPAHRAIQAALVLHAKG
jgi:2-dehydropantoate 2-reductase